MPYTTWQTFLAVACFLGYLLLCALFPNRAETETPTVARG